MLAALAILISNAYLPSPLRLPLSYYPLPDFSASHCTKNWQMRPIEQGSKNHTQNVAPEVLAASVSLCRLLLYLPFLLFSARTVVCYSYRLITTSGSQHMVLRFVYIDLGRSFKQMNRIYIYSTSYLFIDDVWVFSNFSLLKIRLQ